MSLRDRQRAETRHRIQRQAIKLFVDRGYDATTVNDVAAAAGVSAMTVYRHFPTKEDLVLYDDFDQLAAATISELPATGSPTDRIGRTVLATFDLASTHDRELLLDRLRLMISTPALQARHLDSQYRLQEAFVTGIDDPTAEFQTRAAAGAVLGVAYTALLRWAAEDGESSLPELFREAFTSTFGQSL
ncbi:TetR family transcriptional regulator [Kribbella capetownensis]|uniref:TetR family transcriptional regulator n=1 Tax=Kribbella capetownensis TaxID=1572659 RepID=A0A4R0JJM0_9ACTN|nr:TetR/AcrR family transcriptional regulator [Kribbella capetownensis]TCC46487.1 TetR family transcriptional regulator [Kribbella capetownensis]